PVIRYGAKTERRIEAGGPAAKTRSVFSGTSTLRLAESVTVRACAQTAGNANRRAVVATATAARPTSLSKPWSELEAAGASWRTSGCIRQLLTGSAWFRHVFSYCDGFRTPARSSSAARSTAGPPACDRPSERSRGAGGHPYPRSLWEN